jgi:hypothetical protein
MTNSAVTKSIIHVAGYKSCGFYRRAASVVASLSILFPNKLQVVEHEFTSREEYREWLINSDNGGFRDKVTNKVGNLRANTFTSSPFCWLANTSDSSADDITDFIGGCDDTLDWCRNFAQPPASTASNKEEEVANM